MTKRCYDAMAEGCLPVIVTKRRHWMTLPFPGQVDWHAFALFRSIDSKVENITLDKQNPAALRPQGSGSYFEVFRRF